MAYRWIERDEYAYLTRRQVVTPPATTPVESSSTPVNPPVTTTPTTGSTTQTTSSTSTSSTTSSTSTTSTSTTSLLTTVPSTSSTTSTTSTTTSQNLSTRPDGGVVTLTLTSTTTPTPTTTGVGSSSGFFQNTAAVAAVFTVSGIIGLVLLFVLVTTCIRRRRERKFDRDVAEAAAAAAAASANPFFEDEEERGGAHWDPRRTSAMAGGGGGYGKIEDPYGYAAAGVVGGAGFARNGSQYQQHTPQDAYGMSDLGSSGHPSSAYSNNHPSTMYSNNTGYNPAQNSYYAEQPQVDYSRPSFSSNVPGIAGVGSGGGAQQYSQDNQLRYRGQQPNNYGVEDAYGGYTGAAVAGSSEGERYPNPYANQQSSLAYSPSQARRSVNTSPPLPPVPPSHSPPPREAPPPPSYSGHGHPSTSQGEKARPLSNQMPMPPPQQPLPPAPGTPDESWNDGGRILRVANE